MTTEWFKEWFNKPYYQLLYRHRNQDEALLFLENLLKWLRPKPDARFLDLGCGRGRHATFLASRGFEVTGLDLSPENITAANAFNRPNLSFYIHDMRRLYCSRFFDYTLNLFTSFGYFKTEREHLQTLQHIHQGLKPGGIFVLDFLNATKTIKELRPFEEMEIEGIHFAISRSHRDGIIEKKIKIQDGAKSTIFHERVRAFQPDQVASLIKQAGFEIQATMGNYSLDPFQVHSERLIIIAKSN